ncbi:MAG: hypothetical protein QXJ17_01520 [Nitrososphaeria archaeon]
MSSKYIFQSPTKLNFVATKEGFLVFRNGDALSGLTLKAQSLTVAVTIGSKDLAVVNLALSPTSSLVILNAKSLYISPSNDSAVVNIDLAQLESGLS